MLCKGEIRNQHLHVLSAYASRSIGLCLHRITFAQTVILLAEHLVAVRAALMALGEGAVEILRALLASATVAQLFVVGTILLAAFVAD